MAERLGGAAPAEQSGHADGVRVVGFEHILAAVGVPDRGLAACRESSSTSARALRVPSPPKITIFSALAIRRRGAIEVGVGRTDHRALGDDRVVDRLARHLGRGDVARQDR